VKLLYYWAKFFKKLHGKAIIDSTIHKTSKIEAGSEIVNCLFGKYSFCGYNCEIVNCEIGAYCSISNTVIIGGGMHPMDWVGMSPVFYKGRDSVKTKFSGHERPKPRKTIIGNDVWIGHSVIIKQGITIGDGAVIGMGSIVTKDVAPYSIVAGSPAKEIRKRFAPEIIDKLQKIKWWEFDEDKLSKFALFFTDPTRFICEVEK
jgi:acetyltransferase-like isoleucine patch superfamily enzyme